MRLRGVGIAVGAALVVTGYLATDAYDLMPGMLTLAPPAATPAPFPTAPGAEGPPAPTVALDHLDPDAPVPAAADVAGLAGALVSDWRMGTSTGVVVVDALTGQTLADVGGATPRTPASTTKLLTALAAIQALGPERTLATRVVQVAPGQIALVGGGDMMLAAGAGGSGVNGRAGLGDLAVATATALQAAGTAKVSLLLDDSLFAGPAVHPDWSPADVRMGYVAPVSALAVDLARTSDEPYSPPQSDPAMRAAEVFAAALAEQQVTVTSIGRARDVTGPQLAAVESAPLREIVRFTVHASDNTLAEVLGRLVAVERGLSASFTGATRAVVAEVSAAGVDTSGVRIADCSGLADGSALPARSLTDLLALAASPGHAELLPVVVDLPVSGWQGTLADRMRSGPATGLVRAKTGSLRGVTSLAGTLQTQGGRLLVFAVLADRTPPGGQLRPRAAIDEFLQRLAALA